MAMATATGDKYEALQQYFAQSGKPKYFVERVCKELWSAVKAWKVDNFAPAPAKVDTETYLSDYKDTVQHELCEAIEQIDMFACAHGVDIWAYYEMLKAYRSGIEPEKKRVVIVK